MGRIVVTEFVSLDGVVEDPGGAEDFKYGGWTFEIDRGDEGNEFKLQETRDTAAMLLGRRHLRGLRGRVAASARASSPTCSTGCPSTSYPRRSRTRSGTTRP